MRSSRRITAWALPLLLLYSALVIRHSAFADTHYVSLTGGHIPPYTNWAMAATNVQVAVDAAVAGDTVLVTDGVYRVGGRVAGTGALTNRVYVPVALTVRSVNGPGVTVIEGTPDPLLTNGPAAIRCCQLSLGATLSGFTLTNGYTLASGATASEVQGGGVWAFGAQISNCVITGNGAQGGGGGVAWGVVRDSLLSGNSTTNEGGGAYNSALRNCQVVGNQAGEGGGAAIGSLTNCLVQGNVARVGGGCRASIARGCLIHGNTAALTGGGAYFGDYFNCSIVGNTAQSCGGLWGGRLYNSIVYFNEAPTSANWNGVTTSVGSCSIPLLPGAGSLTDDPQFVAWGRLSSNSPCRGAGNPAWSQGFDLDMQNWQAPPSIGCDEYVAGTLTGSLAVVIKAVTNVGMVGQKIEFASIVDGRASLILWDWGDGAKTTNHVVASHTWSGTGTNWVKLTAINESNPSGVSAVLVVIITNAPSIKVTKTLAQGAAIAGSSVEFRIVVVNTGIVGWASVQVRDAFDPIFLAPVTSMPPTDASAPGLLSWTNLGALLPGSNLAVTALFHVVSNAPSAETTNRAVAWAETTNAAAVFALTSSVPFTTRSNITIHVAPSGSDTNSGRSWLEAKATIQAAVNLAERGDLVLVSNGVYQTGGKPRYPGEITNRVMITNDIVVRSVNGACVTIIEGQGPVGSNAVRCVYIISGLLDGFTLTNGHTDVGSGWQGYGGGAYASIGTLENCVISGNSAYYAGGGCFEGTLRNCVLSGNNGGGVAAHSNGGTLYNCLITENQGSGASGVTLINCTVMGNADGGISACNAINSVIYYNRSDGIYQEHGPGDRLVNSCTTPMPSGLGNFTNAPKVAGVRNPHLLPISPCIDAGGTTSTSTAFDIDGETRTNGPLVDVGCDEFWLPGITGLLTAAINVAPQTVVVGSSLTFYADTMGRPIGLIWELPDGGRVTDEVSMTHAFTNTGSFEITLRVSNLTHAVAATVTVEVVEGVHFVAPGGDHIPPYTNWAMAATNIQAAIDVATNLGSTVWVSNGIYNTGGRVAVGLLTNRVAITNPISVRSTSGPSQTTIVGGQTPGATNGDASIRCVYLASGAVLDGFSLIGGATREGYGDDSRGGGAIGVSVAAILTNCFVVGNHAYQGGGGVAGGTLFNCALVSNTAVVGQGGGVSGSIVWDCHIEANRSIENDGGGAGGCEIHRSHIRRNAAPYAGGSVDSVLHNCAVVLNTAGAAGGCGGGILFSCVVVGNQAESAVEGDGGGGVAWAELHNCTVALNSSARAGGGAAEGTVAVNSIIYHNSAPIGPNYAEWTEGSESTFSNCCTHPMPPGGGNLTNDPVFADLALSNLDLLAASPCIDSGSAQPWMSGAVEVGGRPRILGGSVDMGAHEFRFEAQLAGFLIGALDPTSSLMRVATPASNSPFASAAVIAAAPPSNAVDWVQVSVRPSPTSAPAASVAAVLLADGRVVMPDGGTNVLIEAKGNQHVVLQHRNHLGVMTAGAVLTNRYGSFDFSTNVWGVLGTTNSMLPLGNGKWGLIPGDADGDGAIRAADEAIRHSQEGP